MLEIGHAALMLGWCLVVLLSVVELATLIAAGERIRRGAKYGWSDALGDIACAIAIIPILIMLRYAAQKPEGATVVMAYTAIQGLKSLINRGSLLGSILRRLSWHNGGV